MKKIIIFAVIITAALFTSCSSKEALKYQSVYIVKSIDDETIITYERIPLEISDFIIKDKIKEGNKILVDYNTNEISRLTPAIPLWIWIVGGIIFLIGLGVSIAHIAMFFLFMSCMMRVYWPIFFRKE